MTKALDEEEAGTATNKTFSEKSWVRETGGRREFEVLGLVEGKIWILLFLLFVLLCFLGVSSSLSSASDFSSSAAASFSVSSLWSRLFVEGLSVNLCPSCCFQIIFWENWSLGAWSTLVSTPEVQTSLSALWARFLVIEFRAEGCYFVRGELFYYDFFVSFFGVSSTSARRQSFVRTNFLSSHHEISRLLSSTTNSTSNFAGFSAMLSLQNCSLFVTWSLEGSGFTQRRSLSNLWPFRLLHFVLSLSTYLWRACS
jgi:hypothetical protein